MPRQAVSQGKAAENKKKLNSSRKVAFYSILTKWLEREYVG